MGVKVYEQHAPAKPVNADTKIEGRGGLANTAFLIDHGGDGCPALLRCSRVCPPEQCRDRSLRNPVIAADSRTGELAGTQIAQHRLVVDGEALCDLDYSEDSRAEVDANVVMTGDGGLVEVQATAERTPLSRASLDDLLALAEAGIARLRDAQAEATSELRS